MVLLQRKLYFPMDPFLGGGSNFFQGGGGGGSKC